MIMKNESVRKEVYTTLQSSHTQIWLSSMMEEHQHEEQKAKNIKTDLKEERGRREQGEQIK